MHDCAFNLRLRTDGMERNAGDHAPRHAWKHTPHAMIPCVISLGDSVRPPPARAMDAALSWTKLCKR